MTTGLGILGGRPRRGSRQGVLTSASGLGAVPAGVVIAFQIDMRTAGASTRTDGVMDAASCSSLARLLADIQAHPTSAGQDEVTHDAEQRILLGAAAIQALCQSPSTAAAPTTSTGTASNVPSQYWPDARVKSAQTLLSAELAKAGCSTTIKADGLIGPGTCGALTWAVPRAGLSPELIALVRANAAPFQTACNAFKPVMPSCPAAPAPAPLPSPPPSQPVVDGRALMVQLQGVLNQALVRFGYNPIPVSGKWDAATCGAGATVNPLLPLGDAMRTQIGSLTAQVIVALGKPCGTTIAGAAPTKAAAPLPAPVPPKPAAPRPVAKPAAPAKVDPCFIEFGTANSVVREMQVELNKLLDKNGYLPIPVSGKWDAASCGAIFVLGGQFDPYIAACRGGYWSVPASCPQKVMPTKKVAEPAPMQAGMGSVMGLGILAALGAVGVVIAKKKGFFG